jgi:hypothetical protein
MLRESGTHYLFTTHFISSRPRVPLLCGAERDAALLMLAEKQKGRLRRIIVGADKAYDSEDSVRTVQEFNVTPHDAKNDNGRLSNHDPRTTRQPGYAVSLSRRWQVEKGFAG